MGDLENSLLEYFDNSSNYTYYRVKAVQLALEVNKNLKKYRNLYETEDIYIVGSGPTSLKFKETDRDAIYIGINAAYKNDNIIFDYLFCQDHSENEDEFSAFLKYRNKDCIKFLAYIPRDYEYKIIEQEIMPYEKKLNIERYILDGIKMGQIPYDISVEPFSDLKGTVFSALQFAFYTNPKNIFLVGFDCSTMNVYNNRDEDYFYQFKSWEIIAEFTKRIGLYDRISSINPVNLKGIFRDIYTE